MWRLLAYFLLPVGIFFLAIAARDEHRGVTSARPPYGSGGLPIAGRPIIIAKQDDPKQFRNLMFYEWLRGPVFIGGALIILGICRRADRVDPFSADFAGNAALDDLQRELTAEQEKHRRPWRFW